MLARWDDTTQIAYYGQGSEIGGKRLRLVDVDARLDDVRESVNVSACVKENDDGQTLQGTP